MIHSYSIVIPAYNEEGRIADCLQSIHAAIAGREDVHVLVVDNHSTDETAAVAASLGAKVLSPDKRVSISELRNLGARVSDCSVLIFLDADMLVPEDWLDRIDEVFDDGVQALGFADLVPREAPWFARLWAQAAVARRRGITQVDFLPGRNICVDRRFFWRVGGFDESLFTSEDKDLTLRIAHAGGSVVSRDDLQLLHLGYERSFGEWVRKEFWRQSSHLRMLRKHGASLRVVRFPLASVAHLGWVVPLAMASVAESWSLAAVLSVLWFAPALTIVARLRLDRRRPLRQLQLAGLYWLRFLVAGTSVVVEGFRSISRDRS